MKGGELSVMKWGVEKGDRAERTMTGASSTVTVTEKVSMAVRHFLASFTLLMPQTLEGIAQKRKDLIRLTVSEGLCWNPRVWADHLVSGACGGREGSSYGG